MTVAECLRPASGRRVLIAADVAIHVRGPDKRALMISRVRSSGSRTTLSDVASPEQMAGARAILYDQSVVLRVTINNAAIAASPLGFGQFNERDRVDSVKMDRYGMSGFAYQ